MGLVMLQVEWGLGRHRYYAKQDHYIGFLKYNYFDWCQVFVTLSLSKIAICLFLLRISKFDHWRKFLYGVIAFLLGTHIPILFIYIFQCRPVNKAWNGNVHGQCFSLDAIWILIIVQGVCSILTDFALAATPIILIRNMKLPKRQKIALNLLMGLGVITALVCIVRTVFSYETKAHDLTWQGIPNAFGRIFEINLGIIAACMPMMRPLWNHGKRKWRAHFLLDKSATQRTRMSQLQWYRAPSSLPWFKRVRRHFQFPLRPVTSQTSSAQSINRTPNSFNEKVVLPPPHPNVTKPRAKSAWPQEYERPENATWAKDVDEPKMSQSIDLPLQGARKSDWERDPEWGAFDFSFHRDDP
ncbi:uncharacterized protein KY384_001237 [Bacidia gigantensis]|uniref:uncharacterized protein n=1 Tax=Bacidia gigantensis TaxID=2732470 RepID=UPI001D042D0E|nr:uncharacterized protein KY384_001237 [Bacidia gigantensis]KAG8534392.1 hypothetical protein KY384_001237 [Bacidia gigantensis]